MVAHLNYTDTQNIAVSILQKLEGTLSVSLQDNSPTNQLAVSQLADWITRGPVNSLTANFKKIIGISVV